jgi:hypothetical protein
MIRFAFGAVIAVAACAWPARADAAEIKKAVEALAEKVGTATLKEDCDALADLTHPKVMEPLGGREKFVAAAKELMKKIKDAGVTITSFKIGEPADPVRGDKEVFVVVGTTIEINTPKGKATGTSCLLGVSADGGKTWRFVDGAPGSAKTRKMFPDLPKSVALPKIEFKLVKD